MRIILTAMAASRREATHVVIAKQIAILLDHDLLATRVLKKSYFAVAHIRTSEGLRIWLEIWRPFFSTLVLGNVGFDFCLSQGRQGILPPVIRVTAYLIDYLPLIGTAVGNDIG